MNNNINDFIPHRNTMKLVDFLVKSDKNYGQVITTVKSTWPMTNNSHVDSMICIELIAQTIAASIGSQNSETKQAGNGFIVEVKNANFTQNEIEIGTELNIDINKRYDREYYGIFEGKVYTEHTIAEAILHVIKANVKLGIQHNEN